MQVRSDGFVRSLNMWRATCCSLACCNTGDIKKAKEGGVHTCSALLMRTKKVQAMVHEQLFKQLFVLGTDSNKNGCLLQQLAEIKGLSDAKIEKLVEAAKKLDTKSGWQTAAIVEKQVVYPAKQLQKCYNMFCNMVLALQRQREIVYINFGAQALNELLGGGLESKAITEMYGEYRYTIDHSQHARRNAGC